MSITLFESAEYTNAKKNNGSFTGSDEGAKLLSNITISIKFTVSYF